MSPQNRNTVFFIKLFIIFWMCIQFRNEIIVSISATSLTTSQRSLMNNECKFGDYETNHVICNLKRLELGSDVNLLQDAEGRTKLDIMCSDSEFYESQLQKNLFRKLQTLNELTIDSCKLLKLENNIFDEFNGLRKLKIITRNLDWSPIKYLEFEVNSMSGLEKLTHLELIDSNIRNIVNGFYCPMKSLKVVNLSGNQISSVQNLGLFSDCQANALQELQTLDLSYNELSSLPDKWAVSSLRHLQQLNLQHNNINELQSQSLADLKSLRIFNASFNRLEQLPSELFHESQELREIYLQNNELYGLADGLFRHLEQLLILDLSSNQLKSHQLSNGTFAGLIRLIVLNLSHNALTKIDTKTFQELYFLQILNLQNNSIGFIEDNAFQPLYNLHTLNLAGNRLHVINDNIFNGLYILSKLTLGNNLISIVDQNAFQNCSDLKEIDLSSNQLFDVPEALKNLPMLKTLDLGENQISQFHSGTFKNLNQLTGLRLIDNQIENITKGMFDNLPRLNVLNLSKNRIQRIERGSFDNNTEIEAIRLDSNFISDINGIFSTLKSLLWLNLADNHLVWFDYAFVPDNVKWLDIHHNYIESLGNYYNLQDQHKIKTLDASHNRLVEIGPTSVPNSVELVFINNNQIRKIHSNTFVDKKNLVRVDLYANELKNLHFNQLRIASNSDKNRLATTEFYLAGNPFECDCSMEWLQRINNYTSLQYPRIMDMENIECIMPHSRGLPSRPIKELESTDFLCSYESHCFASCNCCGLDGCECDMKCPTNCSCYHDQTWSTNMVDCGKQNSQKFPFRIPIDATEIYLDGNNYPELDIGLFRQHSKLTSLYLNSSQIEVIRNQTFFGLSSVEVLHLEDNLLRKLYGYEFIHLPKINEIYLQNNRLSLIGSQTFTHLNNLKILNLEGNKLINIMFWQSLPTIYQQSNNDKLVLQKLLIGNNPWSCDCHFTQEMTRFVAENENILRHSNEIYCKENEDGPKTALDIHTTSLCHDTSLSNTFGLSNSVFEEFIPIITTVLAVVCVFIVATIIFIFREPLKFWFCSAFNIHMCGTSFKKHNQKLYDAVFLYSAKDTDFLIKNISNELEIPNGHIPVFQLCLQHRDLIENVSCNQLLEVISASKRLVVLLTKNFMQTEWSRWEIRRAVQKSLRNKQNKLVVIEDIDIILEAESDKDLRPYLKNSSVSRIRCSDKNFWEKIRLTLPVKTSCRANNYIVDPHQHHQLIHLSQPIVLHERFHHMSTADENMIFRQAPPAYSTDLHRNYSDCTTATASPSSSRSTIGAEVAQLHKHQKPPEHIYLCIDSDCSTVYGASNYHHHVLQSQHNMPLRIWQNGNVQHTSLNENSLPFDV